MAKARIILITLIILTQSCLSQDKLLIDILDFKDSVTLIATSSKFKEYEFCIEKMADIISELKKIKYKSQIESSEGRSPIVIKLVVKGKIIDSWIVNPVRSSIKIGNKYYSFDTSQLTYLKQKYPVSYFAEAKNFNSQSELDIYYNELVHDKKLLYIVCPDFKNQFQGGFTLTFKKDNSFPTPNQVFEYLKPIINKIVAEEKYSLSYEPFGKGEKPDEYIINVDTKDFKLFKEFEDKKAIKGNWIANPYTAYIIRKT